LNRSLFTLSLVAGVVVVVGAISFAVLHRNVDKRPLLRQLAADTNATLPKPAGEQVAMTRVDFTHDTWQVDYRIDPAAEITGARQDRLRRDTLAAICSGSMWHALHHDYAIAVRYTFTDAGVEKTIAVDVAPRGCPWPVSG
jgi:hypothetical protein